MCFAYTSYISYLNPSIVGLGWIPEQEGAASLRAPVRYDLASFYSVLAFVDHRLCPKHGLHQRHNTIIPRSQPEVPGSSKFSWLSLAAVDAQPWSTVSRCPFSDDSTLQFQSLRHYHHLLLLL